MTKAARIKALKGLSARRLVEIYNRVAEANGYKKISRMAYRVQAEEKVLQALKDAGDQIVRLLKPDYVKRGAPGTRFPYYQDGMLASEYVIECHKNGHRAASARHDLQEDSKKKVIRLV